MDGPWTAHRLADELLHVFPYLGRLMTLYMRDGGEEETTMMQVRVLFFIQERSITVSELAKKRHVSLQAASVLVQGLVERGWVTRSPDPKDRRQFRLELTPEGLERAETAKEQIADYLAGFLSGLSAEEKAAAGIFLPALNTLLQNHMENAVINREKQTPVTEEEPAQ